MADKKQLLQERKERLRAAVALEDLDRVPVVPLFNAFAAQVTGLSLAEYSENPTAAYQCSIETAKMLGETDGTQQPVHSPYLLPLLWNTRVRVPGKDLPEQSLWQVEDAEIMRPEDYERIIDEGYGAWIQDYYQNRLEDAFAKALPTIQTVPASIAAWEAEGTPVLAAGVATIPYETFCGGRTLQAFILDLMRMPDKVEAAMQAALPVLIEGARQVMAGQEGSMGIWVGGWRGASELLSPRLWERFVFPYYLELVDAVIQAGSIPILHFDSNWTRDLARLRELPARTCVLSLDGATDIRRAKEVLGDHMCLMGDVPAQLFALGTPQKVKDYALRLIEDLGPTGFILSSGCDIPYNAKFDNVKAMVEAVAT